MQAMKHRVSWFTRFDSEGMLTNACVRPGIQNDQKKDESPDTPSDTVIPCYPLHDWQTKIQRAKPHHSRSEQLFWIVLFVYSSKECHLECSIRYPHDTEYHPDTRWLKTEAPVIDGCREKERDQGKEGSSQKH